MGGLVGWSLQAVFQGIVCFKRWKSVSINPGGLSQDYFEVMIEGWDSMHFAKGNVFEIQVIQSHINSAIFGHLF